MESPDLDLIKQAIQAVDQYEHQEATQSFVTSSPARPLKDSMQSLIAELQTLLVPLQDHLFFTFDPSALWQTVPTIALWWIHDWAIDPKHILAAIATPSTSTQPSATTPESQGLCPWLTLTLDDAHPGQWTVHPASDYPERLTFPPVVWEASTDHFVLPSTDILTYAVHSTEWRLTHSSRTPPSPPAPPATTRRLVWWSLGVNEVWSVRMTLWFSHTHLVSWPLWALLLLGGLLGLLSHQVTIRLVRGLALLTNDSSERGSLS